MSQQNNTRAGIALMIAATIVFALQDGISRHLAGTYNTYMVVMIRYWFFAAFVIVLAARAPGSLRAAARTSQPWLQVLRGVMLAAEICVAVYAFTVLGLIDAMAVFICYPLLVAALSGPVLGDAFGLPLSVTGLGSASVQGVPVPGTFYLLSASVFGWLVTRTRQSR